MSESKRKTKINPTTIDPWSKSRAGARSGRGYRYQDVVGAALLVAIWTSERLPCRVVPEGWDDLVLEFDDDGSRYWQVKSRQPHLGPFTDADLASFVVDGWTRHESRLSVSGTGFTLVVETGTLLLKAGEHLLADSPHVARLIAAIAGRVGTKRAADIVERTSVLVWPAPDETAVRQLSERLNLPPIACVPHVLALRSAIGEAADQNAPVPEVDRRGLTVTDISTIIERITAVVDRDALMEAVSMGVCESVDLISAIVDETFYQGVDVVPGHVVAGLTVSRPEVLEEIDSGLRKRRTALVAGPSGSGKSAALWMTAYENRRCRWYRVMHLESRSDVELIVRHARALIPTNRAPVAFVVDNVGLPGAKAEFWDALVEELALIPGAVLLGAIREEDLFLIRTVPRLTLVRLQLDVALAESIFGQLRNRSQTSWANWREAFELSQRLLLEYIHILTRGDRLSEVVAEQVRTRRRERRDLEINLLTLAGTAATWGADVELSAAGPALGASDPELSAALQRLIGEHLLQERKHGVIGGLHRLRSRAIFDAIHDTPPPTVTRSVRAALPVLVPAHLQVFLVGVLSERNDLVPEVLDAVAAHVLNAGVPAVTETLLAFRVIDFRMIVKRWMRICDEEGVPPAQRSLAARCAIVNADLSNITAFNPQIRAAVRRILQEADDHAELRVALLERLPERWLVDQLVSLRSCIDAARLLDALSGLTDVEPELCVLSGISSSPLGEALRAATLKDLVNVVAVARAVSKETARILVDTSGGTERALAALEDTTPWCRNLRVGLPSPELLDGREVPDLRAESLVARVEYRYVSDALNPNVHETVVDLATTIFSLHPGVDLVRAVAVDARNQPHGYRGVELASKWLKRDAVAGRQQVESNVARSRVVMSMLAAESRTAELATEMTLLEQSVSCLSSFAESWLKDRRQGAAVLQAVNAERLPLLHALLDVASWDTLDEPTSTGKGVPLTPILYECVENVIRRLSNGAENLRAVAAFINGLVHEKIPAAADPSRWRYLGFDESPPQFTRLLSTLQGLGCVAAEIGFGGMTKAQIEDAVRTVRRPLALHKAAMIARSSADVRFDKTCRALQSTLADPRWTVSLMKKEAAKPKAAWPPVDLMLLVHVDRLDHWLAIQDRLVPARSVLSPAFKLIALPVRDNTVLPLFGVTVGHDQLFPALDATEGWTFESYQLPQAGACSTFRAVIDNAVALSSLAVLPGGPRSGVEAAETTRLFEELTRSGQALTGLLQANPESLLLVGVAKFALDLANEAIDEIAEATPSSGELARWALDMLEGIPSPRTSSYNACVLLLTEWEISPERATEWFTESSNACS